MVVTAGAYLILVPMLRNMGNIPGAVVLMMVVCLGVCIAANAMLQTTMTELFPPDLRGAGPGMVSTFGLIGRFGGPLLGGWFIATICGGDMLSYPFLVAPLALIGGLVALFTLPKTGGKYGDPLAEQYESGLTEEQ